jgi:hypothetical protein
LIGRSTENDPLGELPQPVEDSTIASPEQGIDLFSDFNVRFPGNKQYN